MCYFFYTSNYTCDHRVTNETLLHRLGLRTIDAYIPRRQLRWVGHVARIPWLHIQKRSYHHSVLLNLQKVRQKIDLIAAEIILSKTYNISVDSWPPFAQICEKWHDTIIDYLEARSRLSNLPYF